MMEKTQIKKYCWVLVILLFLVGCVSSGRTSTQDLNNYSNNIVNNCYNKVSVYDSISATEKRSLCFCVAERVMVSALYKDFYNMAQIQKESLMSKSINACAEQNGIVLKNAKNYGQKIRQAPSVDMMVGFWESNESKFWLFENGDTLLYFENGQRVWGKWWLDESGLFITKYSVKEKNKVYNFNPIFRFEHFSNNYMRYSIVSGSNRKVFEANRNVNFKN